MTAVQEYKRRSGRYVVEVSGEAIGPVALETIAELTLRTGRVLDGADLARLLEARAATACYDKALDALARRARSARDLERWLGDREQPRAAVAATIERLTTLGLLDDLVFARAFARSRTSTRGFGPRRVVAELARKGVPRQTIDAVMQELDRTDDEEAPDGASRAERERQRVREVAEKRVRSLTSLAPDVARRRLVGWLVRRGFAGGIAAHVARDLFPR